jgi:iron complex transport system ATP-binding protein
MHESDHRSPPMVEFEHVTVVRGPRRALDDLTLRIGACEHVAIVGPNGSGKSTLLKALSRELYPLPDPGTICRVFGRDRWNVFELRARLGIVTGDLAASFDGETRGGDVVLSGFFSALSLESFHVVNPDMRARARTALGRLNVAHLWDRPAYAMSTGELRRVVIARALVHEPRALVLDEPSTALDFAAQRELREAVRALANEGVAIVLVTHALEDVLPEISRAVLLRGGRVVKDGPKAEVLSGESLSELFGTAVTVSERDGWLQAR